MSQSGAINVAGGGGGGSPIETITGNTGGPESPIGNNFNFLTANSRVKFAGTAATETLDFGLSNLILGSSATNITSASTNTGLGQNVLQALISGAGNTILGWESGFSITTGFNNTLIGVAAGDLITLQNNNTGVGSSALGNSIGSDNTAIGHNALTNIAGVGSSNIAIGSQAGLSYTTTEGSNILIGNSGIIGDSHITRIGTQGSSSGQQNKAFMAGITGATPTSGNTPQVVLCDNAGQLTPISSSTAGFVLTSNGTGTPSFQAAGGSTTAFYAYCSTDKTNVTGNNVPYTVLFDSTQRNDGTAFNTATGVFTAPKTGLYSFVANIALEGLDVTSTSILIAIQGSAFDQFAYSVGVGSVNGSGNYFSSASWIIPMTAADTVFILVDCAKTTQTVSVGGGAFGTNISSSFAGYYIGA